jgi:LEM3 (ligand-effect modulator 3) family / CDC50 family
VVRLESSLTVVDRVLSLYVGPVGFKIRSLQSSVVEFTQLYDGYNVKDPLCGINGTYNANRTCTLEFDINQDMEGPVLVYYQLTNFYQNYRKYQQSFDPFQLYGETGPQNSIQAGDCSPLNKLGNITLYPCGLIANTFFNDVFKLVPGSFDSQGRPLAMLETGIAWQSDIDYMYNQPVGFNYGVCPENQCDATCCAGTNWSCEVPYVDKDTGTCYSYFYPNDNTTQYLHETYPGIISPLEGVENEHFIVWMRVAPTPQFRKLYGWFNQSIPNGTKLRFTVNANYAVVPFQGSKTLLLSTNTIFGGRSNVTWIIFVGAGGFFLLAGVFFLAKHLFRPRKLGDPKYLHFKQE